MAECNNPDHEVQHFHSEVLHEADLARESAQQMSEAVFGRSNPSAESEPTNTDTEGEIGTLWGVPVDAEGKQAEPANIDAELEKLKLGLIIPLTNFRALANITYLDFHGQEPGEDPEFDVLEARADAAEAELWVAILAYTRRYHVAGLRELRESKLEATTTGGMFFALVDRIDDAIEAEEKKL